MCDDKKDVIGAHQRILNMASFFFLLDLFLDLFESKWLYEYRIKWNIINGRVYEIDTQKNGIFHTNFVHFFEAVNYHTKKTKKEFQFLNM